MTWQGRTPGRTVQGRARVERNRRVIARHGGICHLCRHPGAEVADHVRNLRRGGTDTEDNLRPAHGRPCPTCGRRCHDLKTAQEAAHGRQRAPRRRPPEQHPGMIYRSTP